MRFGGSPMTLYRTTNVRMQGRNQIVVHCLLKHAVGTAGMTNFEQKKNDGISISSDVIVLQHWPVYFQHWPVYLLISVGYSVVPRARPAEVATSQGQSPEPRAEFRRPSRAGNCR